MFGTRLHCRVPDAGGQAGEASPRNRLRTKRNLAFEGRFRKLLNSNILGWIHLSGSNRRPDDYKLLESPNYLKIRILEYADSELFMVFTGIWVYFGMQKVAGKWLEEIRDLNPAPTTFFIRAQNKLPTSSCGMTVIRICKD